MHFDCAGPRKVCVAGLARLHKAARVTFPHFRNAFRLRRLEQSLCRALGPRHSICKFSHKVALVTFPIAFSTAQARTKSLCRALGPRHFFVFVLHKIALDISNCISIAKVARSLRLGLGPRHFTCKFSDKVALVKFSSASRLHRLVQSLCRALGLRLLAFFCANKWLL